MDRDYLKTKLDQYVGIKEHLQSQKQEKLAEIEEKTLAYRLELNEQLEQAVAEYKEKLVNDYETETKNDIAKVEHYIEVINIMLSETEINSTTETEGDTNE